MPRAIRSVFLCCGVLALSFGLAACGSAQKDEPRIVACVGQVPISSTQLTRWRKLIARLSPEAKRHLLPAGVLGVQPALQAKAFLISSSRVVANADDLGIEIPPGKVADALREDESKEAHGSVIETSALLLRVQAVKRGGAQRQDRLWVTRVQVLEEAVKARQLAQAERALTRAQALAYYNEHQRGFRLPERRDVALFQNFKKKEAELARKEIEGGGNVLSVLARRNEEPVAGGFKRNLTKRGLLHSYELDFFAAKPHTLVGPRKFEIYYTFEVMAVKPARQRSFAEVEQQIRHTLVSGQDRHVLTGIVQAAERRLPIRASCPSI